MCLMWLCCHDIVVHTHLQSPPITNPHSSCSTRHTLHYSLHLHPHHTTPLLTSHHNTLTPNSPHNSQHSYLTTPHAPHHTAVLHMYVLLTLRHREEQLKKQQEDALKPKAPVVPPHVPPSKDTKPASEPFYRVLGPAIYPSTPCHTFVRSLPLV